ncbi:MAG: hypothetical protein A3B90_02495 [Candidatus Magasanikbacteria bacterium RIFCSPHIGHO2_02_FULL_41_13]|uniref:Uncharacterized protein n=1 Tax=Candidatus Magasanikbacteria bacterium RIFCSPHIGHO2_02_FULL_41_13 TaxID=1798676 RepID=A0A1F6M3J6_9BACT|nr:MAG: hypothetical protein A3B90_02495 [Candidatus Magasanikbacteria bacterium RIFCSPHIGHO2_02_FULL_41_13]
MFTSHEHARIEVSISIFPGFPFGGYEDVELEVGVGRLPRDLDQALPQLLREPCSGLGKGVALDTFGIHELSVCGGSRFPRSEQAILGSFRGFVVGDPFGAGAAPVADEVSSPAAGDEGGEGGEDEGDEEGEGSSKHRRTPSWYGIKAAVMPLRSRLDRIVVPSKAPAISISK